MILMNSKILVLAAAFVIIVSGCTGQDASVIQQILKIDVVTGGVEDMNIVVEMPEYARVNRNFTWHMLATPSIGVSDFRFSVYDRCGGLFTAMAPDSFTETSIRANRTKRFEMRYVLADTQVETCKVRFKTSYTSNMTMSQNIVVLEEFEWLEREDRGTRKDIPVHSYRSTNPLRMEFSFSQDQPLIEESEVKMYIDYYDDGTGIINELEPGDVMIKLPGNLEFITCDDYNIDGGMLVLNKEKKFISKKAVRSTCEFITQAEQVIDTRAMLVEALYTYNLDNEFEARILRI